jgi:hypothetical protein
LPIRTERSADRVPLSTLSRPACVHASTPEGSGFVTVHRAESRRLRGLHVRRVSEVAGRRAHRAQVGPTG